MAAPKNPTTHIARLAKRNRRAQGDLTEARKRLWRAIEMADACMMDAAAGDDRSGVLKAVHATTQAVSAYARVVEVGELESRLESLEAALAARPKTPSPGYAGALA